MKKIFPNFLFMFCILALFASTFWYKSKYEESDKQISLLKDTLHSQILEISKSSYDELFGIKKELGLGDTLIEAHRIIWFRYEICVLYLEMKKDSTVQMTYQRGTQKNKLTGYGSNYLLKQEKKVLNHAILLEFHKKLAKIQFLDAVKSTEYLCCYDSGHLKWEAIYPDYTRLQHSTSCHQSVQFASACEYLFQFVDDTLMK
jgi:hypothetical protein